MPNSGEKEYRFCVKEVETAGNLLCNCDMLFRKRYISWGRDRLNLPLCEQITTKDVLLFYRRTNSPFARVHNRSSRLHCILAQLSIMNNIMRKRECSRQDWIGRYAWMKLWEMCVQAKVEELDTERRLNTCKVL